MYYPDKFNWRRASNTWFAVACAISIVSPSVYGQGKDMGAGYCSKHGNYRGASCPSCISSGGKSSVSGGVSSQDQLAIQAAGLLGTMLGEMLRGDPQKAAQLQAEALERARVLQLEAERRKAEVEIQKQQAYSRLRNELKLDSFDGDSGGGLLLKGVDVTPSGGQATLSAKSENELGLKLGDDELEPQAIRAYANNEEGGASAPNTDPMVVDLRKAPSSLTRDSGERLALKLGDDDVQPQVTTTPESAPTPASEPAAPPVPAPNIDSVVVHSAARKTINILDRAVSSTLESLKISQSDQSIEIDSELSEIKAMLNIPPSGNKGDHTVRSISLGHQKSDKSGDKQNVGEILVVRNEETGEVHIDATQEQTGKAAKQHIIHIDRFGNIIAQESR